MTTNNGKQDGGIFAEFDGPLPPGGPEHENWDDIPEPEGPGEASPVAAGNTAFDGIDGDPDAEGDGEVGELASGDEEAPADAPQRNALMSKIITYGGAAALTLGGGWMVNSQFGITDMLFGGGDAPVQMAAVQMPQIPAAGPQLPQRQAGLPGPAGQPSLPPMPSAGPSMPALPPSGINRPPSALGGLPGTEPGRAMLPAPAQPEPAPPPPTAVPDIQVALNTMTNAMREQSQESGREIARALQTGLNQLATGLSTRLDSFDGKLDRVQTSVSALGDRMGTVESRVAALETRPGSVAPRLPAAAPRAPMVAHAATAAPAVPPQRQAVVVRRHVASAAADPAPRGVERTAPVAAARSIQGWSLRGVSQSAALVQNPQGELIRVEMGENVRGLGVVRDIRRDGDSFALVTSQGTIRP